MVTLTEEIKEQIEHDYNYYRELFEKKVEPNDKYYCLGNCSGIDKVLSCLGYETKKKYEVVKKEEE